MDDARAPDLQVVGDRIEVLLDELRGSLDGHAWRHVEEVVGLVTELYGAGLGRILELIGDDGPLRARLADDGLVATLLVLHDLHPATLAERVEAALDGVRPYLESHGGEVEVVRADAAAGTVELRLLGSCDGCPSSAVTLEHTVRTAVADAVPEIAELRVAGLVEPSPPAIPVTLGRLTVATP